MVFEMKKKKGVWVYEVPRRRVNLDTDFMSKWGAGVDRLKELYLDESGPIDFDQIDATLCDLKFSGCTEAARAKGVPADSDVRRTSFLRDAVDEQREHLRSKLEEYVRRML